MKRDDHYIKVKPVQVWPAVNWLEWLMGEDKELIRKPPQDNHKQINYEKQLFTNKKRNDTRN